MPRFAERCSCESYILTPLLESGAAAGINDVRSGALYCYYMLACIDSEVDEPDDGRLLLGKGANWAATRFDP